MNRPFRSTLLAIVLYVLASNLLKLIVNFIAYRIYYHNRATLDTIAVRNRKATLDALIYGKYDKGEN